MEAKLVLPCGVEDCGERVLPRPDKIQLHIYRQNYFILLLVIFNFQSYRITPLESELNNTKIYAFKAIQMRYYTHTKKWFVNWKVLTAKSY